MASAPPIGTAASSPAPSPTASRHQRQIPYCPHLHRPPELARKKLLQTDICDSAGAPSINLTQKSHHKNNRHPQIRLIHSSPARQCPAPGDTPFNRGTPGPPCKSSLSSTHLSLVPVPCPSYFIATVSSAAAQTPHPSQSSALRHAPRDESFTTPSAHRRINKQRREIG